MVGTVKGRECCVWGLRIDSDLRWDLREDLLVLGPPSRVIAVERSVHLPLTSLFILSSNIKTDSRKEETRRATVTSPPDESGLDTALPLQILQFTHKSLNDPNKIRKCFGLRKARENVID